MLWIKNAVQNIPQSRCSASEDTAAQLSHSPGQRHRDRIYCSSMCARVHTDARFLVTRGWCSNLSVCTCRCFYVWVLICACICKIFFFFPACVCVCLQTLLWSSSWTDLFWDWNWVLQTVWLPKYGAPQSQLMMCERRGEQIRTAIPQHADTSWRLTHMCTHTRTDTPRLMGPGLSPVKRSDCQLMFIHRQRHLSSAATYYCHPRIYTAELKGSPAWRLWEDSSGFCVSLTSELTT